MCQFVSFLILLDLVFQDDTFVSFPRPTNMFSLWPDLPGDVQCKISENLTLKERAKVRSVSKTWQQIIDSFPVCFLMICNSFFKDNNALLSLSRVIFSCKEILNLLQKLTSRNSNTVAMCETTC